jgi:hypothetical protein
MFRTRENRKQKKRKERSCRTQGVKGNKKENIIKQRKISAKSKSSAENFLFDPVMGCANTKLPQIDLVHSNPRFYCPSASAM